MKRLLLILLLLTPCLTVRADRVKVRLFSSNTISTLNISVDLGAYHLYADNDRLLEDNISQGRSVIIRCQGNALHISVNDEDYGNVNSIKLEAVDTACILCLNPSNCRQRTYEGNLEIKPLAGKRMQIVNDVEFETYIAGVVQSEIYGDQTSIFRIQAIISRTWALRNIHKHDKDGFNFCDQVHCQAYLNRCVRPDIMMGAIESSGETLVDSTGALIETPFHSNSGGQTANSEDVWRSALPYLRSVQDTFSFGMRQSNWVKTVSIDKWLGYFSKTHKLNIQDSAIRQQLLSFEQPERKVRLLDIPLTRIRVDWQLKSTFFSVSVDSATQNVILHGHGYGHGVGLSQEGAIRMVNLGYSYDSILYHYYTGAVLHHDPTQDRGRLEDYADRLARIIEEDSTDNHPRTKNDDWLGRLFRLRDREAREEIYIEEQQDNEKDWEYEW
ncbi:MAG: SpoIID/LytB domain-containing protein [Bacteroidales bacterium]|nr:SpoIID/LytB domain-containing protein [Bacteroidales bacterium]